MSALYHSVESTPTPACGCCSRDGLGCALNAVSGGSAPTKVELDDDARIEPSFVDMATGPLSDWLAAVAP